MTGWRFRKRIRLLPGLWLNVSKSGITTSIGGDGMTVNYGKPGTRITLSARGTGLSFTSLSRRPTPTGRSHPAVRLLAALLWVFLLCWLASALGRP